MRRSCGWCRGYYKSAGVETRPSCDGFGDAGYQRDRSNVRNQEYDAQIADHRVHNVRSSRQVLNIETRYCFSRVQARRIDKVGGVHSKRAWSFQIRSLKNRIDSSKWVHTGSMGHSTTDVWKEKRDQNQQRHSSTSGKMT